MARQQTKQQKKIIRRVMHEFKEGDLESSHGGKVKSRDQAVAIALHEAGASREQSPAEKKRARRKHKGKQQGGA